MIDLEPFRLDPRLRTPAALNALRRDLGTLSDQEAVSLWVHATSTNDIHFVKWIHGAFVERICGVFGTMPGEAGVGMKPTIPAWLNRQ